MRWLGFLFFCASTVAFAETESPCVITLTDSVRMPHEMVMFDPAERAWQISVRVTDLMNRSDSADVTEAFAAVEATVKPTLENVGAFLQTRTNYATIFDRNDVAEQTQTVFAELALRLERLRIHNAVTQDRKPWQFWRPVPSPELPRAITRIRRLHFNLRDTSTLLRQNTEITQSMLQQARNLKRALESDGAVLVDLTKSLPDPELVRQVRALHQDVLAQVVLIENLRLMLEQRIQIDQLTQERVRNLVSVVLPMVSMMGGAELDLSPLTPEEAKQQSTEDQTSKPDRVSVKAIIAHAKQTRYHNEHNSILKRYVKKYVTEITPDEARDLSVATTYWDTNDWILRYYVENNKSTLKPSDVKMLAKKARFTASDSEIFRTYARHHASKLPAADMMDLANAAYEASTKRAILAMIDL